MTTIQEVPISNICSGLANYMKETPSREADNPSAGLEIHGI
jgi:hypothetical protein